MTMPDTVHARDHATDLTAGGNLDQAEVERFSRLANEWWDPNGKFKPLHLLGPARISFIRQAIEAQPTARLSAEASGASAQPGPAAGPLAGLRILDIGCGGGLTAEPLARLGADVTAIDPARESIEAARAHARDMGLSIDYRATTLEAFLAGDLPVPNEGGGEGPGQASNPPGFDVVICLEVVEHVPDVPAFVATCVSAVKPGGTLVFSTLNRTAKAYALAIVGAEYVLGWLERGTHRWDRFVTPDELADALSAAGARAFDERGLEYRPLRDVWVLGDDLDVNYLMAARRTASSSEAATRPPRETARAMGRG